MIILFLEKKLKYIGTLFLEMEKVLFL